MLSFLLSLAQAQVAQAQTQGAQPNTFVVVGDSGVSAQQAFFAQDNKVYVLDKTENNELQVNGHPAWAASYDLTTNQPSAIDLTTNTFCAGGAALGDGRWIVVGGNQAVTYGGVAVNATTGNPYDNGNGGDQIRLLTIDANDGVSWKEGVSTKGGARWYPTVETLTDGSSIIIGGCTLGAYVNADYQMVNTIEYYPDTENRGVRPMTFLNDTMPLNLYPLTWLMPSGRLFLQAAYSSMVYDMDAQTQTKLPDMPEAVRVYPASGASSLLPLTPDNDYLFEVLFCGGQNMTIQEFGNDTGPATAITQRPADATCVRIQPDAANPQYTADDDLPEGRSMGNFIILPNGKILLLNGIATGTAGYGSAGYAPALPQSNLPDWVVGSSYGDNPLYAPVMYDPKAASGQRFSRVGMGNTTVPRLYHSSATLIADGSVWVSGSNPNPDVTSTHWATEYRVEIFYPEYYSQPRPAPKGLPTTLTYGGQPFDITLSMSDLRNNISNIMNTKVVVNRPGYSTHAINFGMRQLELNSTYDGDKGVLHVSQMPPNAGLFQPGPAMIFVVVNDVPSIGQWVMIGNGQIGPQVMNAVSDLPATVAVPASKQGKGTTGDSNSSSVSAIKISIASLFLGVMGSLLL